MRDTFARLCADIFGSIFFLRRVLMTWVCTREETPGGPTYLVAQPNIQCSTDIDLPATWSKDGTWSYNDLHTISLLGLFVYVAMFAAFSVALYVKRDLFEFLGDKFDDTFCKLSSASK